MGYQYKYSDQEKKLFEALGLIWSIDQLGYSPPMAYENAALRAFVHNMTGPAVEALRRGYIAFTEGTAFRLTPEFDKLITF